MRHLLVRSTLLLLFLPNLLADESADRLAELDAYWAEVSKAVGTGNFELYKATCHPAGVLVSGSKKYSQPLAKALERWKSDFAATKSGRVTSSVTFRWSQRLGDDTTAHETGIFLYMSTDADGNPIKEYVHLEALLIKTDRWRILMEYQKSQATKAEWDALE